MKTTTLPFLQITFFMAGLVLAVPTAMAQPDGAYYGRTGGTLHRINLDGTGDSPLAAVGTIAESIAVTAQHIWYVTGANPGQGSIHRINIDGTAPIALAPIAGAYFSVDYDPVEKKVYYLNSAGWGRMNPDGSGGEMIWVRLSWNDGMTLLPDRA